MMLFNSYRVLFFIVLFVVLSGWRRAERKNWPGLVMLAITAALAWRSRRHAPFFGVAALAFAGPYLQMLFSGLSSRLRSGAPGFFQAGAGRDDAFTAGWPLLSR